MSLVRRRRDCLPYQRSLTCFLKSILRLQVPQAVHRQCLVTVKLRQDHAQLIMAGEQLRKVRLINLILRRESDHLLFYFSRSFLL